MDLKSSKNEYIFDDNFDAIKIISNTDKSISAIEAEKQRKDISKFLKNISK